MSSDHQPDILIVISDQHTARLMGSAGDATVDTPHMDALAADGVRFTNATTACPLCVPARCAFMTARLPSSTGVFGNANIMPSEVATFAHSCGAAGYETVLCGRMHFSGQDQRHGFMRRVMGDFTPCTQGRSGASRSDLGPYVCTPAGEWDKHYGGGDSPVLAYDRAVIEAAVEELKRPHDQPLLLVVGTYGPHHTFVAPEDLYRKYLDRVPAPLDAAAVDMIDADRAKSGNRGLCAEEIRCIRAAYYGMIEQTDRHLGTVRSAWDGHLQRSGHAGICAYTSDHGEQAGNRGLWGKMTLFDDAVGIPLIISGDGVERAVVCDSPVSLMDLSVTACDLAGGPALPDRDGRSLRPALAGGSLPDRPVISDIWRGGAGRLVRTRDWSYWRFAGGDEAMLVDRRQDPQELRNVAVDHPAVCAALDLQLRQGWDPAAIALGQQTRHQQEAIFAAWGANDLVPEPDRWPVPESSWALPTR